MKTKKLSYVVGLTIALAITNTLVLQKGQNSFLLTLANVETLSSENNPQQESGENKNNWIIGQEMVGRRICIRGHSIVAPTTGCSYDCSEYAYINCCESSSESNCCNRAFHDTRCK